VWKVIFIAPTQERAEKLKELLADNGFLCQLKTVGTHRNGKAASIEISVPVSEANDAYEVLAEHGFQA
jgi:predicted ArsR family transcriptional regulator